MKIGNIVIDCADPDRVATFWAAALRYDKGEYPEEMRLALLGGGLTAAELTDRAIAEDPKVRARACSSSGCLSPRRSRTGSTSTSTPSTAVLSPPRSTPRWSGCGGWARR